MFLTLLILFLDTFDTACATLTFSYPRQTTRQDDVSGLQSGWTPRPTSPPRFLPWLAAPSQGELAVRQDVKIGTCGWLSGDVDSPLDCGTEVCAYYNNYATKGFVCCPTTASGSIEAGSCPYRSSCLHLGEYPNTHWGSGEIIGTDHVLSCGYMDPYCYVMANSDSVGGNTWWFFGCDTVTGVYSASMSFTSGAPKIGPTSPPLNASLAPSSSSQEQDGASTEQPLLLQDPVIATEQELFNVEKEAVTSTV